MRNDDSYREWMKWQWYKENRIHNENEKNKKVEEVKFKKIENSNGNKVIDDNNNNINKKNYNLSDIHLSSQNKKNTN